MAVKFFRRIYIIWEKLIQKYMINFLKNKTEYLQKAGIPLKISSLIIIISLFFIIIITVFQYLNSKGELGKQNEEMENRLAERLKYEFSMSLWDYDIQVILNLLKTEMGNENIRSIMINDERKGMVAWLKRENNVIVNAETEPKGINIKRIDIPVIYTDRFHNQMKIGSINLWMDYKKIYNDFYNSLLINIVRMILIILLIVLTILIVTIVKLAKPLISLRMKMNEAGDFIQKNENIKTGMKVSGYSFSELREMDEELDGFFKKINTSSNELKKINIHLEDLVRVRTDELIKSNINLLKLNKNLEAAYDNLKNTQNQLIDSEKMVILGNLVAGIAHEINTPLGAIISSNNMMKTMIDDLKLLLKNYGKLEEKNKKVFDYLMSIVYDYDNRIIDFNEDRTKRKQFLAVFNSEGFKNSDIYVEMLIDMGFNGNEKKLREILQCPVILKIIKDIYKISTSVKSYHIVKVASEKASIVVNALKTYTYQNRENKKTRSNIIKDIEIILTLYHNKIKYGVEIIRNYDAVPDFEYHSEKLNNVWSNLISNALYAMNYKGRLEIRITYKDGNVTVSIIDDGPGIPDELKEKIFQPFFTTKKQGEGTGLGLDITNRIVNEIGGRLEFESKPGRTIFSVCLKAGGVKT